MEDMEGKWMLVMVTSMHDPGKFHVIFPYGGLWRVKSKND